ncbi:MAG: response regulator transcription factor [Beijerinckiaceae bacterium]|nr:response regulator transcription factor [Beijerinckiaceae bacterium]
MNTSRAAPALEAGEIKILIVGNEPSVRKLLRSRLRAEGYGVVGVATGHESIAAMEIAPDVMILCLELPDVHGFEILRAVRDQGHNTAIIVLSNRRDETSIVAALDRGADDYVTKPFGVEELLARVRAALRHRLRTRVEKPLFQTGALSVDIAHRIVLRDGATVKLSPKEYELLCLLVQYAGKVVTSAFIIRRLWTEATEPQYLRVLVRQLRKKIEPAPERPSYILTETGVGYRLRGQDPVPAEENGAGS